MPINMQIEYPKLVAENTMLRMENEKLRQALKNIINDWEGETPYKTPPEFKTLVIENVPEVSYWSPAGKMVKAELIAAAKTAINNSQ